MTNLNEAVEQVEEGCFEVLSDKEIVKLREYGRNLASELGFSLNDRTLIATAISELTRNILDYAGQGTITMRSLSLATKKGLIIEAVDHGPGIVDLGKAVQSGFSTGDGLGLGLPGLNLIMDEFHVQTKRGEGTKVVVVKWIH